MSDRILIGILAICVIWVGVANLLRARYLARLDARIRKLEDGR